MPGGHVAFQGSSLKTFPLAAAAKKNFRKIKGSNPDKLYVKGIFQGYTGGKKNQHPKCALIQLQNVNCKEDAAWYLGKKLVYVYKAKTADKNGKKFRAIWGKVTRSHGNSGVVRASFRSNLPPAAMGKRVRCMLFPSQV